MKRGQRRRIAWVWSISYTFASLCVSGAVWAQLSFFLAQSQPPPVSDRFSLEAAQARRSGDRDFFSRAPSSSPVSAPIPRSSLVREVASQGGRALLLVLVLACPGFQLNQAIWAALRARPRRVWGLRIYKWKLLALNVVILLAAPFGASLQFVLQHSRFVAR